MRETKIIDRKNEWERFKAFLEINRVTVLMALIVIYSAFGHMLTNPTVTIDEETWILADAPSVLWLLQERTGLYLFDLFFTSYGNFAPFLWDFLAIFFWSVSGFVLAYSFWGRTEALENEKFPKGKKVYWGYFWFIVYYSTLPFVVGEQLDFSQQGFPVSLGMVCIALAVLFTIKFLENKKKKQLLYAFMLYLAGACTYQALIGLYVTAVVAYCIVLFLQEKQYLKFIEVSAALSIGAAAAYTVINKVTAYIIGSADYLTNSYWGWSDGIGRALFMACANVVRVSFAIPIQEEYVYGGGVIRTVSILFVAGSIWKFCKTKGIVPKFQAAFLSAALMVSPFCLYLVLGTYKTRGRMLVALALAGAFELYLLWEAFRKTKWRYAAAVFCSLLIFFNARNMNMIFYYQSIVYHHDQTIANQIMYDVEKTGADYHVFPIVFVGMKEMDQIAIQTSGALGGSMFEWDDGNIARMEDFMETEGYKLVSSSSEQRKKAVEAAAQMKDWPQEGSIQLLDDIIVVRLSEPTEKWFITNGVQ